MKHFQPRRRAYFSAVIATIFILPAAALAWLDGPGDMGGITTGVAEAWKLDPAMEKSHFSENDSLRVNLIASSVPANILRAGEKAELTIQIVNKTKTTIDIPATLDVIRYALETPGSDVFKQTMRRLDSSPGGTVALHIAPGAFQNVMFTPPIPAQFGGYAVVLDAGESGRFFAAGVTRTITPDDRPVQYPQFSLDQMDPVYLERLGVKAIRFGVGYKPTTDKDFDKWYAGVTEKIRNFEKHHVTVLLTVWWGAQDGPMQPMGRKRPWLADDDRMLGGNVKPDVAWQPKYDPDFQEWCRRLASDFGWPKGPVTGFAFWNEPWEGGSVDYWGADMLRFREVYTAMAQGVVAARARANVNVLLCGCDSTSNTMDKLFPDGKDTFLPWLDVATVHYQGMAVPSLYKAWNNRAQGKVLIWDTESWSANSDDRIAAAAAGTFSAGQNRLLGVYRGRAIQEADVQVLGDKGSKKVNVAQTFSVAAAEVAANTLIGERRFQRLLFTNGLPNVTIFRGGPDQDFYQPDDGTIVVTGDLGLACNRDSQVFRTVQALANRKAGVELKAQLDALPADAPNRAMLLAQLKLLGYRSGGTMTFPDNGGKFLLLDFYGNPVPADHGAITVPLDGRGFFLRTDGSAGSFDALIDAVKSARIDGFEPVEIKARDMLARIDQKPSATVILTNVLNRPIAGTLSATLGKLNLAVPTDPIQLAAGETREIVLAIRGGAESPDNSYPLHVTFDAGADGTVPLDETLHVNVIAKRTITVDGKLDDWQGIPGQLITDSGGGGPSLAESAWFTTVQKFDPATTGGAAVGYLAYDADNFYFAAKIADSTPEDGMRRYEKLDDDEFFYPADTYELAKDGSGKKILHHWPDDVRRYTYRKRYDLPAGNAPQHDNVQIAFNAIEAGDDDMEAYPPGTMPGYIAYHCTDHEFALNPVAEKYGGGTEIWKLSMPGMPEKQFFPRQPKSPFDGPVPGKLVITHDGGTRITEVAIPWSEMPLVKKRLDAGQTLKFSFRVNDNATSGTLELARGRSVSKINPLAFQAHWKEHWANEVQFAFEK